MLILVCLSPLSPQFDSDGTGTLERNELGALAQQLVPGLPEIEQCYLQALLDADGDGAISYEELMDAVSDIVHAGHAAKDAHSSEALQVLSRVREAIGTRGHELEDLFAEADRSRHGELSFTELGNLLRGLVPSLSAHELRFLVAMVRQWDVDGNGKTSMKELLHALHIGR